MSERNLTEIVEKLLKRYKKEMVKPEELLIITQLYLNEDDGYIHRQIIIDFKTNYQPPKKEAPKYYI